MNVRFIRLMKFSLRLRLTVWYTAILVLTLTSFGVLNYATVSQELNHNLNSSVMRVAESLKYIIESKLRETKAPLKPAKTESKNTSKSRGKNHETTLEELQIFTETRSRPIIGPLRPNNEPERTDEVWSAVYEHILLNPKNYVIQVADVAGSIVWRSDNLLGKELPIASELLTERAQVYGESRREVVERFNLQGQSLRLLAYQTPAIQITVGYPVTEIEATLGDLFSTLVLSVPIVLLISIVGGWFLAKASLQPIEVVTQAARDITAHNLSQRIPVPPVNDEIARLVRTLNAMIGRLENSFRQIRQFTGDASHELRTPLAILTGELELAMRSPHSDEEYRDVIASALEEVDRLSKVVKNLLDLSRAETGQIALEIEFLNLSTLVDEISDDAEILAEEKEITVERSIEANVRLFVDKVKFHQAFLNVIENAIKYTEAGGHIFVGVRKVGLDALIEVRDSGEGIPAEDLDKIFDRFYRVDKSRTSSISGHGLGLSIVKWIVEAHRGKIWAESQSGQGSTFYIRLPLRRAGETDELRHTDDELLLQ